MSSVGREKDTVICDLDGTIALDHHRAHHLHPPHAEHCAANPKNAMQGYDPLCTCGWKRDWTSYFDACGGDEPNWPVIDILGYLWEDGYNIRILSGRTARVQAITEKWLRENAVPHHTLILRPENVFTDDYILKPAIAFSNGWTKDNVYLVFEDRQRVVDAWRSLGYTVFQVASGNF